MISSRKTYVCFLMICLVVFLISGCNAEEYEITSLKPPSVFYYGTIISIEKWENGYLVYTSCPGNTQWDPTELVPMWITDQTMIDSELMAQIETGKTGGIFKAGIYNINGVLPDRVVKQVVTMDTVDELPK